MHLGRYFYVEGGSMESCPPTGNGARFWLWLLRVLVLVSAVSVVSYFVVLLARCLFFALCVCECFYFGN